MRTMNLKHNNKGFSLIEIIICIAIIGLVFLGMSQMMQSGTKSYATASKEIALQTESQKVYNLMVDRIMQAKEFSIKEEGTGVIYGKDSSLTPFVIANPGDPTHVYKIDYIYTGTHTIIYNKATKSIYVNKSVGTPDFTLNEDNLVCNICTDFTLTIADPTTNEVTLHLSFEKKKSSIDLDGKVRIRNGYVLYDYTKGTTSST